VQPTDHRVRSVFVFTGSAKAGRRNAWILSPSARAGNQESASMKDRLFRLLSVIGVVAATAIAGGASLKGF
jgi:hypothetical protein